jgi:hypothetical protein
VQRVAELVEEGGRVVQEISTGSPSRPGMKLELFETMVVTSPSTRCCRR